MSNSQNAGHGDREDDDGPVGHQPNDWLQWLRDQVIEENDDDDDDDDDFSGESMTSGNFPQFSDDELVGHGAGDVEFEVVIEELPAGYGEDGEGSRDDGGAEGQDAAEPHRRVVRIGRGMWTWPTSLPFDPLTELFQVGAGGLSYRSVSS